RRKKILIRKKKNPISHIFKFVIVTSVLLIIFTGVGSMLSLEYLKARDKHVPALETVFPEIPLASSVMDRNGELLYRMYGDQSNNDKLELEELNSLTIAAFLAAEDAEFFN